MNWIKYPETIPHEEKSYLVTCNRCVTKSFFTSKAVENDGIVSVVHTWHCLESEEGAILFDVKAYMELPEPYEDKSCVEDNMGYEKIEIYNPESEYNQASYKYIPYPDQKHVDLGDIREAQGYVKQQVLEPYYGDGCTQVIEILVFKSINHPCERIVEIWDFCDQIIQFYCLTDNSFLKFLKEFSEIKKNMMVIEDKEQKLHKILQK